VAVQGSALASLHMVDREEVCSVRQCCPYAACHDGTEQADVTLLASESEDMST
jgi:hypothetical protein